MTLDPPEDSAAGSNTQRALSNMRKLIISGELAAEKAALVGYGASALSNLSVAIAEMDAALEAHDLEHWAKADDRFHRELVRLGGNSRAMMMFDMLRGRVARAGLSTLHVRPPPMKSSADHCAVMDAIKSGDGKTAAELHRTHRQYAEAMLVDLLNKHRMQRL